MTNGKIILLDPRGQPSGIFGRRAEPGTGLMNIFDPDLQPVISKDKMKSLRLAPRLDNLKNKTVYLVDTGFAGSHDFLEEVQDWFAQNMPSVKTLLKTKPETMFADSPQLWTEIQQNGDGVVLGVGG